MMKAALARTPPALSPSTKKRWYIARKSGQSGPYGDVEFAAQADDDAIEPGDLVWRPGFLAWVRAEEVPGLLIPPPLPERAARQTDRGEALRLVVTNDRECAAPAALEDCRNEIAPMAEARPEREKTGEASQSPADAAPRPTSPQLSAVTGGATTDASPATADAAPAARVAEDAADPMTLDGPNFDRLRALLDVSDPATPSAATVSLRNYASLRSQLKQHGAAPGPKGSPMSQRKRALRATTMRVLAGALLGGVAASCIYAAFFGSRSLDVAWLWLQAVGMHLL